MSQKRHGKGLSLGQTVDALSKIAKCSIGDYILVDDLPRIAAASAYHINKLRRVINKQNKLIKERV